MGLKSYSAKRDANEKEIVYALEVVGATVVRLSVKNVPDLLVGYRGMNYLLEVKDVGGRVLKGQQGFIDLWEGFKPMVVWTVEEALRAIGAIGKKEDWTMKLPKRMT